MPARLDRERRTLDDVLPSPPSSLDMDRRPSAARTGRSEMAERLADHRTLTPAITAGDVDANVEDAYFTGEEAPGGDNPTPDQDRVDDIGRALGVQYQDDEELRGAEKLQEPSSPVESEKEAETGIIRIFRWPTMASRRRFRWTRRWRRASTS